MLLVIALPLGGCHFDDEVEGQPEVDVPDAAPDGAVGCTEGAVEPCAIIDGCGGERTCVGGEFGACIAPEERCDGVDNDCDGAADEGYADLGSACSAGEGACAADGVRVCGADGEGVVCDAVAGTPSDEACNGLDDDCDGTADEDFGGGMPCETGEQGVCAAGTTACEAGGTICVRDAEPSAELCDGLDNDCDGTADEGEDGGALVRECYDGPADTVGNGPCLGGTQTCEGGVYGACVGQVLPGVEICDGLDNDCDAETDDVDGGCACLPGETRDCYTGPDGTAGVGACRMGTQTCLEDGSTFGPCDGEVVPAGEVCATRDQDLDCDGDTDDVPGTGEACSVGVGACAADGRTVCGADDAVVCDAVAGEPTVEVCDGIDNDCNGVIDDVAGLGDACQVGIGACMADGVQICDVDAGAVVCDAVAGEPAAEICDGLDNDCDGEADDVDGLGDACTVGIGVCAADGSRVCDLDAGALVCDATPGQPAAEICDGLDNDCNGTTDDVAGLGGACSVGIGACAAAGSRVCDLDAGELVCDAVAGQPVAETCDGLDNDCNGEADDVAGLGDACEVGVGACLSVGVRICDLDAGALVCDAVAGDVLVEICDGIDNDCNGEVDDVDGLGDPCSDGVGACRADGVRVCDVGARQLVCDAQAGQQGAETCDGIDNDCNGIVDDVVGLGDACSVGIGVCERDGARVCDLDAQQLVCDAQAGQPAAEVCDGLDNDCNGTIDDAAGVGQACSEGIGACQRDGTRVCDLGAGQVVCDAQPGQPAAEICDGLDNDCNGEEDDVAGLGDACSAGTGACERNGNRICDIDAGQLVCSVQGGQPAGEICDGLDNDCNGQVDDVPGLGQACSAGIGACQRNGTRVCDLGARQLVCDAQPGQPGAELCDGLDNDCNGQVDDAAGVGQACSAGVGACQRNGTRVCDAGARQLVCNAQPGQPSNEICDGLDNDCNGQVDNVAGLGQACTAGQGICQRNGSRVCDVGARQLVCDARPGQPGNETCDNRDEDCDGRTDENVTQACYPGPGGTQNVGACRGGTQTCNNGAFGACQGAVTPTDEFCSGQDNDCNGQIDDVYAEFEATDFPADAQCFDFAIGDLDRNGRPDVVCSFNGNDGRLGYWLDAGVGNFGGVRYTAAAPRRMYKVEIADIDRDGDPDLIGVGSFMPPQVFINNNGNLAAPVQAFAFAAGMASTSGLALADMTGDGLIDIVTSIQRDGIWRLAIAQGNGNGTFAAPAEPATGPDLYDIAIGDIDQDGDIDVLGLTGGSAGVFRANGRNFADYAPLINFPNFPQKMRYADFTGDGRRDLVVGTEARWFFGRAQGPGFAFTETADRGTIMAVTDTEIDCDPLRDVVMTRSNPRAPILLVADPQTQSRIFERFSAHGWGLESLDVTGDGLEDLILPDDEGGFHLLRQLP